MISVHVLDAVHDSMTATDLALVAVTLRGTRVYMSLDQRTGKLRVVSSRALPLTDDSPLTTFDTVFCNDGTFILGGTAPNSSLL